jgi:hypothetical protein
VRRQRAAEHRGDARRQEREGAVPSLEGGTHEEIAGVANGPPPSAQALPLSAKTPIAEAEADTPERQACTHCAKGLTRRGEGRKLPGQDADGRTGEQRTMRTAPFAAWIIATLAACGGRVQAERVSEDARDGAERPRRRQYVEQRRREC